MYQAFTYINVSRFTISANHTVILFKDESLALLDAHQKEQWRIQLKTAEASSVTFFDQIIHVFDTVEANDFLINFKGEILKNKLKEDQVILNHFAGNRGNLVISLQAKDTFLGIYDIKRMEPKWQSSLSSSIRSGFVEDHIWAFDKKERSLLYFLTMSGQLSWSINLKEFGEVNKILGVYSNLLWLWMRDCRLVGIDMRDGKLIHAFYPLLQIFSEHHHRFRFPSRISKSGKVFFLEASYYLEVDLNTLTASVLSNLGEGLIVHGNVESLEKIYFGGSRLGSVYSSTIGVFDQKTKVIEWEKSFVLEDYAGLLLPKVQGDTFGVLDTTGVLNVFTKEQHELK